MDEEKTQTRLIVPVSITKAHGTRPNIEIIQGGGYSCEYVRKNEYGNWQKCAQGERPTACILTINASGAGGC